MTVLRRSRWHLSLALQRAGRGRRGGRVRSTAARGWHTCRRASPARTPSARAGTRQSLAKHSAAPLAALPAHSLVMKEMNSDRHSCTVSLASFAILALPAAARTGQCSSMRAHKYAAGQRCSEHKESRWISVSMQAVSPQPSLTWQRLFHDAADVGNRQQPVLVPAALSSGGGVAQMMAEQGQNEVRGGRHEAAPTFLWRRAAAAASCARPHA